VETLKRVNAVFADAVAGGAVVNISLLAAKGVMVTAELVAGVPPSLVPVSVAVKVHEVPVSMITLLNVETKGFEPPVAFTVNVEAPSNVHDDEEITMGSPDAPPAVIDTVKLVNAVPALTLDWSVENESVEADADAGSTPTRVTPASSSAAPRPIPARPFALDAIERRPASFRLVIFIWKTPLSTNRPQQCIYSLLEC